MNTLRILCLIAPLSILVSACATAPQVQLASNQPPAVLLIVPEQDTTVTGASVYRLSASVTPGCTATLNGVKQNVYPSGAFAGLLHLAVGENRFTIEATDASGRKAGKQFLVVRTPPPASTRTDTLAIDSTMLLPATDLWLDTGDLLSVQCKGTPGCKVTFLRDQPMYELPPEQTGGVRGIYRGVYRIEGGDAVDSLPVVFQLTDSTGRTVTRESPGRVSVVPGRFPMVGITKGRLPYLNFGLGEDRLGGAIMQRLVPGVRLRITGKVGSMYRVSLAEGHEAWIEDDFVTIAPHGAFVPSSLTSNWNVTADDHRDYVNVTLEDRLPYTSVQEINPTRIVVDVYGAVANSNWIIQQLNTQEIQNVRYTQTGKDVFRIIIDLKHRQLWGYSIGYSGTNLVIAVKHPPKRLTIGALKFVLDAGHGGDNNGALGSTGSKEKDVNLSTVLHLKQLLEDRGATVVLTRGADTAATMYGRLARGLQPDVDLLISVHSNSIGLTSNPEDTRGVSTYYKHIAFRPLSLCIIKRVAETGLPVYGNVGSFNFLLNTPTEVPNALVELAYMSNPLDEMKLLDDDFRKELARKIVQGIQDFLDESEE